ncbi:hypothetical protein COU80_05480 [Candidatus Peregrinibacteria bacterium CG10_big_fil_rev_8_21_14_0_10_55_24]|nr:MAG: hypothetical protein COU80_05480 [Candidatus Peregrinibacteria bacterium CG10_big_fil_rev_8_21_14_0_10_55_24]
MRKIPVISGQWFLLTLAISLTHILASGMVETHLWGQAVQTNLCQMLPNQAACEAEGCTWSETRQCLGELYPGCATNERECRKICGGTVWLEDGVCSGFSTRSTEENMQSPVHGKDDTDVQVSTGALEELKSEVSEEQELKIVLSGTLVDEEDKPVAGATVRQMYGAGQESFALTDAQGAFEVSVHSSESGIGVLLAESNGKHALGIVRFGSEDIGAVILRLNEIGLHAPESSAEYFASELRQIVSAPSAHQTTGTGAPLLKDTKGVFTMDASLSLRVPENATFSIDVPMDLGGFVVEGTVLQDEDTVIRGEYAQVGGRFEAREGTVQFTGNFTLEDGLFVGGQATMEIANDLVGTFNLLGGTFQAPKMLHMQGDWKQTNGTFDPGEGTVVFRGTTHAVDVPQAVLLYDVVIEKENGTDLDISEDDVLIIQHMLKLEDGEVDGGTLVPQGDMEISPSFDGGTALLLIGEDMSGDIWIPGGASLPRVALDAPNVTLHGPSQAGEIVYVEGAMRIDGGTLTVEGGDLLFTAQAPVSLSAGSIRTSAGHLTIESPVSLDGGDMVILNGTVLLGSTVTMNGGTVFLNNGQLSVNGAWNVHGGEIRAQAGSLELNSLFVLHDGDVFVDAAKVTANSFFTLNGGTFTGGTADMAVFNTLTLGGGSFTAPSGTLIISGDISQSDGVFLHNGGTVRLTGLKRTIAADRLHFFNLIFEKQNKESAVLEQRSIVVEGNAMFVDGFIDGGIVECRGDVTVSKTYDGESALILMNGAGLQHLSLESPDSLGDDIIVHTSSEVVLESDLDLKRSGQHLTIEEGVFSFNGNNLSVTEKKAAFTIGEKGILHISGDEQWDAPTIVEGGTISFSRSRGDLVLPDLPYHTIILSAGEKASFSVPKEGLKLTGDVVMRAGEFIADDEQEISLAGNWMNEGGEFVPGQSTVIFTGTQQSIAGNNTFYNVKKTVTSSAGLSPESLVVEGQTAQVILNSLTLMGSDCNFLRVRSTTTDAEWSIDVRGEAQMRSLDVRDVNNVGGALLICTEECVDRGNNTNWQFEFPTCSVSTVDCGNGVVETGEGCDDGNISFSWQQDGCSETCTVEPGYVCTGAPSVCTARCGDGLLAGGEICDDANTEPGDGCSQQCMAEDGYVCTGTPSLCQSVCGDGAVRGQEVCDDGNVQSGDGCTAQCLPETGFTCTGQPSACAPICGDGKLMGLEICDDGNAENGDGCSALCTREEGFTCIGEPSACAPVCGDGILRGSEVCDDGNAQHDDGCSDTCIPEWGFVCQGEPSMCTALCSTFANDLDECPLASDLYRVEFVQWAGQSVKGSGILRLTENRTLEYSFTLGQTVPNATANLTGEGLSILEFEGGPKIWSGITRQLSEEEVELLSGEKCSITVQKGTSLSSASIGMIVRHTTRLSADDDDDDDNPPGKERRCGNGKIDAGEACDDGNTINTDGCLTTCEKAWCGDGYVSFGKEQCEPPLSQVPDPVLAGKTGFCDDKCQFIPSSSDGETGGGSTKKPTKSSSSSSSSQHISSAAPARIVVGTGGLIIIPETCGNGFLDSGEQCDHGEFNGMGSCTLQCTLLYCGDGIVSPHIGEQCDDANSDDTDSCSHLCFRTGLSTQTGSTAAVFSTPISKTIAVMTEHGCGNALLEPGEQCDDGNTSGGDGCNAVCKLEFSFTPPLEAEPVLVQEIADREQMIIRGCGDGVLQAGEQCDDANAFAGDGCSSSCRLELGSRVPTLPDLVISTSFCGNGLQEVAEQCDDGNTFSQDGCSNVCQREVPGERQDDEWRGTLPSAPERPILLQGAQCGDGILQTGEACDAGTQNSDILPDRCRVRCTLPYCGDGVRDSSEQCDDGNRMDGDGCSWSCYMELVRPQAVCGNAQREANEQCDDGNTLSGDGCSSRCRIEEPPRPVSPGEAQIDQVILTAPTVIRLQFRNPVDPQKAADVRNYSVHGSPQIPIAHIRVIDQYTVELVLAESLSYDHEYTLSVDVETQVGEDVSELTLFTISPESGTQVTQRFTIVEEEMGDHVGTTQMERPAASAQEPAVQEDRVPLVSGEIPVFTASSGTEDMAQTGPGALLLVTMGAAAGLGWIRRRRKALS